MAEPHEASDLDESASAMAGMMWSMFSRLRAEGATTDEAALLAARYMAAVTVANLGRMS